MSDVGVRSGVPPVASDRRALVSPLLILAAGAIYVVALSAESIRGHATFRSTFDTAVYDQRLSLLARGLDPFSTIVSKPFLGDHFEPALVLFTPLYWLGLGVSGILVVQTLGIALVSPALYVLARAAGASSVLAAIPALLWLIAPATASANVFGFRPAFLAPLMLVTSVIALRKERPFLLAASVVMAFSLKEDMPVTYLVLALLAALEGKRRVGAILAGASLVWLVLSSAVVRSLSGQLEWQFERFAGERGDSPGELLGHFAAHPLETLELAARNSGFVVLVLLAATGGLCFLAARWMLLALPTTAFNALSAYELQHELAHHYHSVAAASFFIAAAIGVRRLHALNRFWKAAVVCGMGGAVGVAAAAAPAAHLDPPRIPTTERAALRAELDRLPPEAPTSATPDLLPYLSRRVAVYTFPEPFVPIAWGSSLTAEEYAQRARGVRFVALGLDTPVEYHGDLADVREALIARGWRSRVRVGDVEILERP